MHMIVFLLLLAASAVQAAGLTGRVVDTQSRPLGWANLTLEGTTLGATADAEGRFELANLPAGSYSLAVSLVGYEPLKKTVALDANETETLTLVLREAALPGPEVDVITTRDQTGITTETPVRTEIISGSDLEAASETGSVIAALADETGLKTRPCALCGSCGVGVQGLDPSYTEVNVDGLPVLAGLGTLYGMDGLAAADVSRLEIVKGAASAETGSGAIAGAVNLVTTRPDTSVAFRAGTMVSNYGQNTVTLSAARPVGGLPLRVSLLHAAEPERIDENHDGLTDTPKYHRLNLSVQTGRGDDETGWAAGFRTYDEHRFAGELHWSGADRGSANVYGREILTQRSELSLRVNRCLDPWDLKAQTALVLHEQDSWYGTTEFDALQRMAVTELSAAREWNERHSTLFQLVHTWQHYADNLALATATDLDLNVPGVVAQHTWAISEQLALQAGNRAELYADDGLILIPRGALHYRPGLNTTLRLTGGLGYRPVTIFNLDEAVEAGFDHVSLGADLDAERSRSLSLGLNRLWALPALTVSVDLAAYYTHFDRKVIVALGDTPGTTVYGMSRNAYSRSAELQARLLHTRGWQFKLGGTRTQIRYQSGGQWHDTELQYQYTADAALARVWQKPGLTAEVNVNVYGPQALPEGRGRAHSPAYALWDTELRKRWEHLELSLALRNVFNWTQAENPFQRDPNSGRLIPDAALMYGPVLGRTLHLGLAYSL